MISTLQLKSLKHIELVPRKIYAFIPATWGVLNLVFCPGPGHIDIVPDSRNGRHCLHPRVNTTPPLSHVHPWDMPAPNPVHSSLAEWHPTPMSRGDAVFSLLSFHFYQVSWCELRYSECQVRKVNESNGEKTIRRKKRGRNKDDVREKTCRIIDQSITSRGTKTLRLDGKPDQPDETLRPKCCFWFLDTTGWSMPPRGSSQGAHYNLQV